MKGNKRKFYENNKETECLGHFNKYNFPSKDKIIL